MPDDSPLSHGLSMYSESRAHHRERVRAAEAALLRLGLVRITDQLLAAQLYMDPQSHRTVVLAEYQQAYGSQVHPAGWALYGSLDRLTGTTDDFSAAIEYLYGAAPGILAALRAFPTSTFDLSPTTSDRPGDAGAEGVRSWYHRTAIPALRGAETLSRQHEFGPRSSIEQLCTAIHRIREASEQGSEELPHLIHAASETAAEVERSLRSGWL